MEAPLGLRKGAWTAEEDDRLRKCIEKYGEGKWQRVPLAAGLNRCRKSCRLRWLNYLKPNINRGKFTADEVDLMIRMHKLLGNSQADNEITWWQSLLDGKQMEHETLYNPLSAFELNIDHLIEKSFSYPEVNNTMVGDTSMLIHKENKKEENDDILTTLDVDLWNFLEI